MSDRIYLKGEEIWEEYTAHDTPVPGCSERACRRRIDLENQRTAAIHYGQFAQKQIQEAKDEQRRKDIDRYGDI